MKSTHQFLSTIGISSKKVRRSMLRLILASMFVMLSIAASAAPTVSGVIAKQRCPWNGLVDITCEVIGIAKANGEFKFDMAIVMADSGDVRKVSQFWVVKNGMKTDDRKVHGDGGYRFIWDAQSELGAAVCSNMVMRVSIVDVHGKVQLWEGGPYWAEVNIGAVNPYDVGYYFWWGDTVGHMRINDSWVPADGSEFDSSLLQHNKAANIDNSTLFPDLSGIASQIEHKKVPNDMITNAPKYGVRDVT